MTESSIQLEQAFYGNAKSNYQLLASSSSQYSSVVTKCCEGIGTPDGISTVSPFLFSVPYQNVVMMFCCQSGEPDSNMRQTLFFHALIAERNKAELFNVNAFSLWKAGYFSSKLHNPCKAFTLSAPLPPDNTGSKAFSWGGESLAIVSNKEENQLMHGLLGKQVNSIPWSSFSFQPLNDFRLYVISQYVVRPQDRKCVTTSGEPIAVPSKPTDSSRYTQPTIPPKTSSFSKALVVVLFLSLFANVLLVVFGSPQTKTVVKEVPKEVVKVVYKEPEAEAMVELNNKLKNCENEIKKLKNDLNDKDKAIEELKKNSITREKVIEELKGKFPEEKEIPALNAIVVKDGYLQRLRDSKEQDEIGVFAKIQTYIDFVNNYILTSKTTGEQ